MQNRDSGLCIVVNFRLLEPPGAQDMAKRSYSTTVTKQLFGSCGNQCAAPDCTNPIIVRETEYSDTAVIGQICHIYAAADNGPRGKPGLKPAERNALNNLILMCGYHHPLVDKQHETYPADLLKQWKKEQRRNTSRKRRRR